EPTELRRALIEGDVDLALGAFLEFKGDNLYEQTLFSQGFACVLRKDHPSIGDTISVEQFLQAGHAVVAQEGGSQALFERKLQELGYRRRIVLRSPHFMSVPLLLSQSNLIATVPLAVGRIYAKLANLRVLPVPFEVPTVYLKQCWHRRGHGDPASIWFRKLVASLFVGRDPTQAEDSILWSRFNAQ
ncbi:MAG TPA: LysR substrate-binding domain-containing protein, partial [Burkholderiales bacterium]